MFSRSFCKRTKSSRVLFRSFKKYGAFFPFFSVLCKRTYRSFHSFGFHKSPKTRENNGKERMFSFLNGKDRNVLNGKEPGAQPCLILSILLNSQCILLNTQCTFLFLVKFIALCILLYF